MRYICTSIVATLLLAGTTFAATLNVPGDYALIQDAINASVNGDVIQIEAGTYNEHSLNPGGKAITIQGTGAGGTTIDGQQGGNVFVFNSGEGSGTLIHDLVITGGAANNNGGGISCTNHSNPTISGCSIQGNTATDNGCGISCDSSNPTISNCVVQNNTGGNWGGGIYCYYSNPTITGSMISGNTTGVGGGIMCFANSNPTITDCTIENNTASQGGGIYCTSGYPNTNYGCKPVISNCTIEGNTATNGGGGIYFDFSGSSPSLTNCTFTSNTVSGASGGAGIYCVSSSPTIRNCTFDIGDTIALDDESTLNPIGACCYDGLCWSISEEECNDVSGSYTAESCSADTSCPTPCSSDSNNDGDVDVDDLMNLIGSFGACP